MVAVTSSFFHGGEPQGSPLLPPMAAPPFALPALPPVDMPPPPLSLPPPGLPALPPAPAPPVAEPLCIDTLPPAVLPPVVAPAAPEVAPLPALEGLGAPPPLSPEEQPTTSETPQIAVAAANDHALAGMKEACIKNSPTSSK